MHAAARVAEDPARAADPHGGAGGEFHIADVERLFGQGKFIHDLLRGQARNVVGGAERRDTARRRFLKRRYLTQLSSPTILPVAGSIR